MPEDCILTKLRRQSHCEHTPSADTNTTSTETDPNRSKHVFECAHDSCVGRMVDDKYIGLGLAISSSLAIGNIFLVTVLMSLGTSFVITKKVSSYPQSISYACRA